MPLKFMYITNNPSVASIIQKNGVDRVFVDLEKLGKEQRQKGMDTVKNTHTVEDVKRLSKVCNSSELLVRINPWNEGSADEIDAVISAGADRLMLPMWKSADEVRRFISAASGRVKNVLLLETKEAVECLDDVLKLSGIDEIHIGLNDLHLSYGLKFMFELLSNGTVEKLCNKIKAAGIPYGFGGIARIGGGTLPAEKILSEHYRLESSAVILSRSFCNIDLFDSIDEFENVFSSELQKIREEETAIEKKSADELLKTKKEVDQCIKSIIKDL